MIHESGDSIRATLLRGMDGLTLVRPQLATQAREIAVQLLGLAVLAGTLAALVALCYRWYTREAVPREFALLVGLGGVAAYLNTTTAMGRALTGGLEEEINIAMFYIGAFLIASAGAVLGRRAGDHFGNDVLLDRGTDDVDENVNRLVQTVGRVIAVELPEDIDDVVGYDPVPEKTKEKLAGKRFVFPRNLTVEELRTRLTSRLKTDYAVGHVDLELATDGSVEHIAIGTRAAGIGPTLPPATNALAIKTDPAYAASSGDLVQVWETNPMRRVLTGELRGVAGDVVTVAIDSADTPKVDPTREYRLVTLPVNDRPGREFASLLRSADETFSSITVEAGSPLHGMPTGALDLTIISIKPEAGDPVILPGRNYILAPGDMVFAIAKSGTLRRLETAAKPLNTAILDQLDSGPSRPEESAKTTPQPAQDQVVQPVEKDSSDEREETEQTQHDSPASPGLDSHSDEVASETTAEAKAQSIETAEATNEDETVDSPQELDDDLMTSQAGSDTFDELKSALEGNTDDQTPDEMHGTAEDDDDVGDEDEEQDANGKSGEGDSGMNPVQGDATADTTSREDDVVPLEEADISFDEAEEADDLSALGVDEDRESSTATDIDADGESHGDLSAVSFEDESNEDAYLSDPDEDLDGAFADDDEGETSEEDEAATDDPSKEDEAATDDPSEEDEAATDDPSEDDDTETDFEQGFDESFDGGFDEIDDSPTADNVSIESEDRTENSESGNDNENTTDASGTFAQLKEEFESGEAEWADDISDSPGGDMRLDE